MICVTLRYVGPRIEFSPVMLLAFRRLYRSRLALRRPAAPSLKSLVTRRSICVSRSSNSVCGATMGSVTVAAAPADRLRPNAGATCAFVYVRHVVDVQMFPVLEDTTAAPGRF